MDKISYIEKDARSATPKYVISLNNGKNITIYKKENYRKLITVFLDMKKTPEGNKDKKINDKKESKKDALRYDEKNEIDNMNIGNTEKIIALDPLDIKEYRP
jgi:ABC-type Fe3+-hydroxamate transport system substrate-binding protein